MDLARRLAVSQGEPPTIDAEKWYLQSFGKAPSYSELLEALARTPDERQGLLRSYIEPTPEEEALGLKRPTESHIAIAKLVSQGLLKVIVTINFDHLIESALRDQGISPVVLDSPSDVKGAKPLDHVDCCVLKLHGDYQSPQILNTTEELSNYDPAVDRFLDRIFDDYGLIV